MKKKQEKKQEKREYTVGHYDSPLGDILIAADETGITGMWFEGQKYYAAGLPQETQGSTESEAEKPGAEAGKPGAATEQPGETASLFINQAKKWLDTYFQGIKPDYKLPLHLRGTEFQAEVWNILLEIPYGETVTYGQIAAQIAGRRGLKTMSAQAVGSAVGHNPVSIVVPCHRVIGKDGSLTGYAGGVERKASLLALEYLAIQP